MIKQLRDITILFVTLGLVSAIAFAEDSNITNTTTSTSTVTSTNTNNNTSTSTSNVTSNITQTQNVTNTNNSTVSSTSNNTNLSTNSNSIEINSLYDKNLIKIVKPELFPIDKFKEALLKIKNRKSIGKLCLCTNSYINKLKV